MTYLKPIPFLIIMLLSPFFIKCEKSTTLQIEFLSGYWEVDFVERNGEQFRPKISQPLYDFYHVENKKGIRKKVAPKFDGNFQTSEDQTPFDLDLNEGKTFLYFKTLWDSWSEQIVYLDSTKLVLFHQKSNYHYKRP